jgi:heme exporter protein D
MGDYSAAVWIIVGIVALIMALLTALGCVCCKAAVDETDNAQMQ